METNSNLRYGNLTCGVDSATQHATVYVHGRPCATLQRRRVLADGPTWRAYALDGTEIGQGFIGPRVALIACNKYLCARQNARPVMKARPVVETESDEPTMTNIKAELSAYGISFRERSDGEYRINYAGGNERTAYYTDCRLDALDTGRAMARTVRRAESQLQQLCPELPARACHVAALSAVSS